MKKYLLLLFAVVLSFSCIAADSTASFTTNGKNSLPNTVSNITITPAQHTGQAPGGSHSNQYRLYSGNTLTISAAAGYVITKITSTASSTDYQLSNTKATCVQGTIVTNGVTLSSDAQSVILNFTDEVRFKSITVSYKEGSPTSGKTPVTLTWSSPEDEININGAYTVPTLTVNPAEAASAVTVESSNPAIISVNADSTLAFHAGVDGTAEVTASIPATNETYSATPATYTLKVVDPSKKVYKDVISQDNFSGFTDTYKVYSFTSEATEVKYVALGFKSNGIQINTSASSTAKESSILSTENTDNLIIESVVVTTYNATDKLNNLRVSNEPGSAKADGTLGSKSGGVVSSPSKYDEVVATISADSKEFTFVPKGDYKFFYISSKGAVQITGVTVTYKPAGPQKQDPELSFDKAEVTFVEDSDEAKAFEGLNLNNHYGVTVTYSSSDSNVADIDETGYVLIGSHGEATITATSAENGTYLAGSASYKIIVTEKAKQPVTLSFSESTFSGYAGEIFEEGLPLLTKSAEVAVTYSSSDTNIAEIDEQGTKLTLVAAGTATITASFAGNESYNSSSASYTVTVIPGLGNITVNGNEVTDGETITVGEGKQIIITAENAESMNIIYNSTDDIDEVEVDGSSYTWIASAQREYDFAVEATLATLSNEVSFKVSVVGNVQVDTVKVTASALGVEGTAYNDYEKEIDGITFAGCLGGAYPSGVTQSGPAYVFSIRNSNKYGNFGGIAVKVNDTKVCTGVSITQYSNQTTGRKAFAYGSYTAFTTGKGLNTNNVPDDAVKLGEADMQTGKAVSIKLDEEAPYYPYILIMSNGALQIENISFEWVKRYAVPEVTFVHTGNLSEGGYVRFSMSHSKGDKARIWYFHEEKANRGAAKVHRAPSLGSNDNWT